MSAAAAVRSIGWKAHAALARSDGHVGPLAQSPATAYVRAGSEILWIGTGAAALHPRAVVLVAGAGLATHARVEVNGHAPWRPAALPQGGEIAPALAAGCEHLHRHLDRIGAPRGFATMLAGGVAPFPLDHAARHVRAFARAMEAGDPDGAYAAALPLLGAGPGLTPAGDDLVGAALFGRRALVAGTSRAPAWQAIADRLAAGIHGRTHPVSAALFADLVAGESFAVLHDLAEALAARRAPDALVAAARRLVTIGHSSGWEMLAGFIIGITGRVTPDPHPARAIKDTS